MTTPYHRMLVNLQPDVYKAVALTVPDALKRAMEYAVPAVDAVATNDATNQHANASVILPDGTELLKNAPGKPPLVAGEVPHGMAQVHLRPPGARPHEELDREGQRHLREHPRGRGSTARKVIPLLLHPGTDKHAPQVQPLEYDLIATGHYTTVALSGAVAPSRKRELLDRL